MMKYVKHLKFTTSFLVLLTALLLAGCQKEEDYPVPLAKGSFQLAVRELEGADGADGVQTRSLPATIGRVSYYLVDHTGEILEMPFTGVAPDLSYIRVENLRNGEYRLLVLAESDPKDLPWVTIRKLKNAADPWLEFTSEQLSLPQKEYYYADHPFRVHNGTISHPQVTLSRILGKVAVKIRTNSEFAAEGAIRKVELIPDGETAAYSTLTGLGTYAAAKPYPRIDITQSREFTSWPLSQEAPFTGQIVVTALTSEGSEAVSVYRFQTTITPNTLNTITVDYKHPDDQTAGLYIPFVRYHSGNSSRILQDNEPQAVYYNASLRSFNIKTPLQYGFDDDQKLYIRFYSAVGMSKVRLMWRDNQGENLEFARFDTIPPFFEAHLEHPLSKRGGMMKTQDGRFVHREAIPNLKNAGLRLSIACEDTYWKKIQAIIPSVDVRFASYGGNPDVPNGGPSGNWMGIRPVHIREACALLTNLFYLVSTEDFPKMVHSHDGEFTNNDRGNVPAATIVNQYRSNRSLVVGLVWSGTGTIGLGGGQTWGIWQHAFFNHYADSQTAWHEMSHCIGYNHTSNMTYGRFSEVYAPALYSTVARKGGLPVSYPSILQSSSNPNRY